MREVNNIEGIKNRIGRLSVKERLDLIKYIKSSYSVFDEYSTVKTCNFCTSTNIVKNGTRKGVQKFICRDCKRNFTYKTNTVLSGVHELEKWNMFVEDFMSLKITPLEELKIKLGVSSQTVFNWRHKLLASLSSSDIKFRNEEIEFDETYFLISRKGRQNLNLGKNRSGYRWWRKNQVGDSNYNTKLFFTYGRTSKQVELYLSHMGRTSSSDLEKYFLPSKFNNVRIYSDSHPSYKMFFRNSQFPHETFMSKFHIGLYNKKVHNQTINVHVRGFKDFVNKNLRGVSTKYLPMYAGWYQFIQDVKNNIKRDLKCDNKVKFNITDKICKEVVVDKNGLELFRQSEYSFIKFLQQNGRTNFGICKNHYYKMTG